MLAHFQECVPLAVLIFSVTYNNLSDNLGQTPPPPRWKLSYKNLGGIFVTAFHNYWSIPSLLRTMASSWLIFLLDIVNSQLLLAAFQILAHLHLHEIWKQLLCGLWSPYIKKNILILSQGYFS